MALLLVRIDEVASLPLNEFYDYNGKCYAFAGDREQSGDTGFPLEDFYEGTVGTEVLDDIPVFFVDASERKLLGWYRRACVYRYPQRPSLFLEGNIVAGCEDVIRLPEKAQFVVADERQNMPVFQVIEKEDERHREYMDRMEHYEGENAFRRYKDIQVKALQKQEKGYEAYIRQCEFLAGRVMNDECQGIGEIKALEQYAKKAVSLNGKDADGYYYLAMACWQLGFGKDGMKAIKKAEQMEPEAADILDQKAALLVSMGHVIPGAELYEEAASRSREEEYLLMAGRAWSMCGQMDRAYHCFRQMENEELLKDAGIQLSDFEKKWSFGSRRKGRIRNLFKPRK